MRRTFYKWELGVLLCILVTVAVASLSSCATDTLMRIASGDVASQAAFEANADAVQGQLRASEGTVKELRGALDAANLLTTAQKNKIAAYESAGNDAMGRAVDAVEASRAPEGGTDWAAIVSGVLGAVVTAYTGAKVGGVISRRRTKKIVENPNVNTDEGLKSSGLA